MHDPDDFDPLDRFILLYITVAVLLLALTPFIFWLRKIL
jgi:hypothetical protein